jgi:cyclic dehypoxanthinyl futalosine synthase
MRWVSSPASRSYGSMAIPEAVRQKVLAGERLSREEGVVLLEQGDLLELGVLADAVRRRKHPEGIVTYIIDRNINYTNVCTAQCAFCAFYRDLPSPEGYLLSRQDLAAKIEETMALGGRQILLQGGLHPDLGIEFYEEMFRWMKGTYPELWIHGLSPAEVKHICKVSSLSTGDAIVRLRAAGLDSIPGGGAEVLSNRVRNIIGIHKGSTEDWLEVMEVAHGLGMRTTATMMFGHVETLAERIDHLLHIRDLQDRTGGFTAFIAWTFQPENTALAGEELTSFQYLRTLAVSRLMLDNVPSIQASWVTQGGKIGQVSLRFGANDFGSLMIEENVVSAAGAHFRLTEAEIARAIQDAGFVPKRRTMHYEIVGDPYCWTHDVPAMPQLAAAR